MAAVVEGARARRWRADCACRASCSQHGRSRRSSRSRSVPTECCLKMVATGLAFESKTTYFRDAWNWLDALTVGVAWLALLPAGNLSSLRSIRVLRPLHGAARNMRVLVGALLASLPDVLDVLALFAFFLLAFGVVGVELFAGRLHYRCYAAASDGPGAVCTCGTLARSRRGGAAATRCAKRANCAVIRRPTPTAVSPASTPPRDGQRVPGNHPRRLDRLDAHVAAALAVHGSRVLPAGCLLRRVLRDQPLPRRCIGQLPPHARAHRT